MASNFNQRKIFISFISKKASAIATPNLRHPPVIGHLLVSMATVQNGCRAPRHASLEYIRSPPSFQHQRASTDRGVSVSLTFSIFRRIFRSIFFLFQFSLGTILNKIFFVIFVFYFCYFLCVVVCCEIFEGKFSF